jgi:hypothetical protein
LSKDGEQDRPGLVIDPDVDAAVVVAAVVVAGAGLDGIEQPLGLERGGEAELDLGGGLLDRDDLGDPPARRCSCRNSAFSRA